MIGYSIEDRGECRPVNGNPPDVGAIVTCFRDRLVVVKVTARVTPPRGGSMRTSTFGPCPLAGAS